MRNQVSRLCFFVFYFIHSFISYAQSFKINNESSVVKVQGADSLKLNIFQHRVNNICSARAFRFQILNAADGKIIYSFFDENKIDKWYQKVFTISTKGFDSLRIEFEQDIRFPQNYVDAFCNRYVVVPELNYRNAPDIESNLKFDSIFYSNGDKYFGLLKKSIRTGFGSYFYYNGDVYSGNWFEGKADGKGIYFYASGDCKIGEWKNGQSLSYRYFKNGKEISIASNKIENVNNVFANFNISISSPSGTKYNLKRFRGVLSNKESIMSIIYGVPKDGFYPSFGNHFIQTIRTEGRSKNIFTPFSNNQISYNSENIFVYNLNKGLNDYNKIYFMSRKSNFIEFNEMILASGDNVPKIESHTLPYEFELKNNGIETFKIGSSTMGNGIGAFLGNSTFDGKSYLFIYDYRSTNKIKKIDISRSSSLLSSKSNNLSGVIFQFTPKINGQTISRYFGTLLNVVENDKYIYAFLSGGDLDIVLPICIDKTDNSVSLKTNSTFNCKAHRLEAINICGYLSVGFFYLPEYRGFANYYMHGSDYQIDVYDYRIDKQYSFKLTDIVVESINDYGNFIIVGGYTTSAGYKGYPNPKVVVINKTTKLVTYSNVITKKNASVNSISHDIDNNLIITIGAKTCKGEPVTDDLFIPQIIVDKINENGKFKNDLFFKE
jgi:hypothetical protein